MASGDELRTQHLSTFSKSAYPFFGALYDYLDTSLGYLRKKTFIGAERLNFQICRTSLSPTFMAAVCLLLGFVCNVKLEVVTFEEALPVDLHFMLMSKDNNFYVDDIDFSKVLWCVEASDCVSLMISCALIWFSSNVSSPLSEYLYLPWLGVALRGAALRQAPTAAALVYTMAVAAETANPLFIVAFLLLFLLESRLWLEVVRLLAARWRHREDAGTAAPAQREVETLWSNEDGQSVEVKNYFY